MLICTLPKELIMPMVCINLLCRLYTSHNLLQFHVSSGVLCGRGFLFYGFCKLNDTGGCMYNIYNVSMLQMFEMG